MDFGDFFSFDKMIAPTIVKPLYWILMIFIVVSGVWMFVFDGLFFFLRDSIDFSDGIANMFWAVAWIVLGIPVVRIFAEIALVQFELRDKGKSPGTPPQPV
jgi:hypothetical protein